MNHTDRIIHVSRQVRGLTREKARQAVELYLASVADELAHGDLVPLQSIGRIQLVIRENSGRLMVDITGDRTQFHKPGNRVQACLRLSDDLKAHCHRLLDSPKPGPTRVKPGELASIRVESGFNPVKSVRKEH